jgi:geranylgeranyl transferase type-2 subunit alpha
MHNRKKADAPRSTAELEGIRKKKLAYSAVADKLLDMKVHGVLSAEALAISDGLLKQNPDYYSMWNHRRTILLSMYGEGGEVSPIGLSSAAPAVGEGRLDSPQAHVVRDTELSLSAAAIKKNPKSYGAWYHRQWILDRINIDVNVELELCKEFLLADQRNFHCWNYRRYLVNAFKVNPRSEFEFSSAKIEENFSNYSAFHHRSVFIDAEAAARSVAEVLGDEISIVENAVYTDPYDQSAFWYLQVVFLTLIRVYNRLTKFVLVVFAAVELFKSRIGKLRDAIATFIFREDRNCTLRAAGGRAQ